MAGTPTKERDAARDAWRRIVASSLDWGQAHVTLERAVDGLPARLRGRRPQGLPYSAWELLEHIRLTQRDLLEFCTSPSYREPEWPEDYWPESAGPPSDGAWEECLAAIERDREELRRWTETAALDLTERIPHGTGQTYLRTVLVALDHTSYHTGQIVLVRRLLGAWEG